MAEVPSADRELVFSSFLAWEIVAMKRIGFAAAAACLIAIGGSARASVITFGFDPNGGGDSFTPNVLDLDWGANSALSKDGLTAIRNFISGIGSTTFTTFTHGSLSAYHDDNGTNFSPAAGTEITFVAGITEKVTNVQIVGSNLTATFGFAPGTPSTNFFEVFFDTSPDSNPLTGLGYNDGLKILGGSTIGIDSTTSYVQGPPIVNLDGVGTNNYPLVKTLTGSGSSSITGSINAIDLGFFSGLSIGDTLTLFTTNQKNPFTQVNPSARFVESQGGAPQLDGAGAAGNPNPSLGPVNGDPFSTYPDFQFQTDASSSFTAVVPEAASVMIWGLLAAVGAAGGAFKRSRLNA